MRPAPCRRAPPPSRRRRERHPDGARALTATPALSRVLARARARLARSGFQPLVALFCASSVFVFLYLMDEALEGGTDRLDRALLVALRRPGDLATPIGPPWLMQSAIDISALGGFTVLWLITLAAAGFLALARRWRALVLLLAAIGGASLLNALFKSGFHRARPDVVPHLTESWSASFPSGHAMISAAAYLTVAAILAQTQTSRAARLYILSLAALITVLIGLSRVYLGVHWPSDVAAGWAAGSAWALAFWIVTREAAPETQDAQAVLETRDARAALRTQAAQAAVETQADRRAP